jgi:NDP-sugar pyrophosphorylase family protein
MFIDSFLLLLLLLIAALAFMAFLFLPSIIEITRPRDKGPRRILKTPLEKIVRHGSHSVYSAKSDSIGNAKDLENLLKELGVRNRIIGEDTIRIFGDIVFPPDFEISANLVVEGELTFGDRCICFGSVKARGNVLVGSHTIIRGNLISKRNVFIEDEAIINGSVHAEGSVRLSEKGFIGFSVVAGGDIELFENSEVKKNILAQGAIKVLKHPKLDFPPSLDAID